MLSNGLHQFTRTPVDLSLKKLRTLRSSKVLISVGMNYLELVWPQVIHDCKD